MHLGPEIRNGDCRYFLVVTLGAPHSSPASQFDFGTTRSAPRAFDGPSTYPLGERSAQRPFRHRSRELSLREQSAKDLYCL